MKEKIKSPRTLNQIKIWHISDSHGYHDLLNVPENIDWVIHSGDFTNYRDVARNELEMLNFIKWYKDLDIPIKILISGNHDAYAFSNTREFTQMCTLNGIIYLDNDYIILDDIKIFGSPNTPKFGDWYFMKDRSKMDKHWKNVDDDVDIFVVHGPPKGFLDLSEDREHNLERCGCNALKKHILNRINPDLCLFGHIHNNKDIINTGTLKLSEHNTIFSNGSIVTDGRFGELTSNGNIINYEKTK